MEGDGGGRRKESGAEERMRLQTDSSTPSSAHTRAQQRHAQALELEKQLRALIQSKGSADPNVRGLRNAIREAYEFVLLEDHAFAEAHEVEPALWRLHYKRIEEFRARLRKGAQAAAATVPAIPMPGARVTPRRDVTLKVLAVYKSFLAEATGFYHELIKKLLAKHGMSQDYPSFSREPGVPDSEERMAEVHRVKQSWHRCLIFLGDLARYKEQNTEQEQRLKDWSVAAGYYLEAAALSPGSGNPHNQLAVLATYVGDELLAVYRYFRSLLVEIPFLTARDNLILLFEKNRQTYSQLPPQDSRMSLVPLDAPKSFNKGKELKGDRMLSLGDGPLKLAVKDRKQDGADINASLANIAEIRKSFRVRFVRLHGILFTKTSLETFSEVYAATVRDMEQLLCPDDTGLEAGLGSDHRSGIGTGSAGAAGVLQLTAILIFTVHNVNWGPENHHPTYAEILQRSALYKHAFTAAFECAGRLMRRCGDSKDPSESPLLPAMLVFMEWLACRPEMAEGSDVDEKQANARTFFWRQCVSLLNDLCVSSKSGIDADSCLEGGLISIGGFGNDESEVGVALWEDFELRGFTPLAPAQLALDYRKRPPRAGLGDRKERQIRTRRILAAGKAVAGLLDGSGKGICFDEDLGRFFMAGELPVKTVKETADTPDIDASGVPFPVQNDMNGLSQALKAAKVTEAWTKGLPAEVHKPNVLEGVAGGMDGEEDEEVIVFKPMSRQSVSSVAMDSWVENPKLGANDGFAAQSSAVSGNGHGSNLALEDQVAGATVSASVQAPALHTGDTAVPVSEATMNAVISTTMHALHQNNQLNGISTAGSASMISSNLPVTIGSLSSAINLPSQEMNAAMTGAPFDPTVGGGADWLVRRDGYPSFASWNMQTPRSTLDGVSVDKLSGAGVIGQHKLGSVPSSWSQELEALASGYRYKNVRYGMENGISGVRSLTTDMPVHSSAAGSSVVPSISLPFSSGPYSSAQAVAKSDTVKSFQNGGIMPTYGSQGFPVSSKPSAQQYLEPEVRKSNSSEATNFANASPAGLLPASVRSSSTSSSTWTNSKETPSASWVGPSGIRPPPGFGPRPTKPLNSNALEAQPALTKPRAPVLVNEGEEQQQVDDYRWLDDFSGIRPTASSQAFQRQTSLYSSDYGIWPSESASRTDGAVSYPYPGTVTAQRRQSAPVYPYESAPGTYEEKSLQQQQQQLLQRQHLYDSQKNYSAEQHYQQQVQYEAAQQQHQHQLLVQQHQQQQQQQQQQLEHQKQQMWYTQYHSGDPFVS